MLKVEHVVILQIMRQDRTVCHALTNMEADKYQNLVGIHTPYFHLHSSGHHIHRQPLFQRQLHAVGQYAHSANNNVLLSG